MCVHGMERIKKYPMSCGMGYDRRWRPEASNQLHVQSRQCSVDEHPNDCVEGCIASCRDTKSDDERA